MKKKSSNLYLTLLGTFHLPENNIDKENNSCSRLKPHRTEPPPCQLCEVVGHSVNPNVTVALLIHDTLRQDFFVFFFIPLTPCRLEIEAEKIFVVISSCSKSVVN